MKALLIVSGKETKLCFIEGKYDLLAMGLFSLQANEVRIGGLSALKTQNQNKIEGLANVLNNSVSRKQIRTRNSKFNNYASMNVVSSGMINSQGIYPKNCVDDEIFIAIRIVFIHAKCTMKGNLQASNKTE